MRFDFELMMSCKYLWIYIFKATAIKYAKMRCTVVHFALRVNIRVHAQYLKVPLKHHLLEQALSDSCLGRNALFDYKLFHQIKNKKINKCTWALAQNFTVTAYFVGIQYNGWNLGLNQVIYYRSRLS